MIVKLIGNRIEGNHCLVRIGDSYGMGCNSRFEGNTFVKTDSDRAAFNVIHMGYWYWSTANNVFVDSLFEGGASYSDYNFNSSATAAEPTANLEFEVAWTLTVDTTNDANVIVEDVFNTEIFNGVANANGFVDVESTDYVKSLQDTGGNPTETTTDYNLHEVFVNKSGSSDSSTIDVDSKKTLVLPVP